MKGEQYYREDSGPELEFDPDKPRLGWLIDELTRTSGRESLRNQARENENTRWCIWENQSEDNRKRDQPNAPAFPFNGASDTRTFTVDSVCEDFVDLLRESFYRALPRAAGVDPTDIDAAGLSTTVLRFLVHNTLRDSLATEVELAAQYTATYGWAAARVTWERQVCTERFMVTTEDLQQMVATFPSDHPMSNFPGLVADPFSEQSAAALLAEHASEMVRNSFASTNKLFNLDLGQDYQLPIKAASKFVRALRDTGLAKLPVPYLRYNGPVIRVLRPWTEIIVPQGTESLQTASVIFHRSVYTEIQFRREAIANGWDETWVESVCRTRGSELWSEETGGPLTTVQRDFLGGSDLRAQEQLVEIFTAYYWALDETGMPVRVFTVFSPHVTSEPNTSEPSYGYHGPLDYYHGELPFVAFTRSRAYRSITDARGIPEILSGKQRELKVHRDALIDLASMAVMPPLMVPQNSLGTSYKFGPGAKNIVTPGREPSFMEIPKSGAPLAIEIQATIQREIDQNFGRATENVDPDMRALKRQASISRFLDSWNQIFRQVFALTVQYMPKETWFRITNQEKPFAPNPGDIANSYDLYINFDARELDSEYINKQAEVVANIKAIDEGGEIDSNKLVQYQLRALNPNLVPELTLGKRGASSRIRDKVRNELVQMFLGMNVEPTVDDNPTAEAELQYAQEEIQSSQRLSQASQSDPVFGEKLQQWVKNKQFNIEQKNNRRVGRTGGKV